MKKYINEILKLADKALKTDNVPVGAIVVKNNKIIGRGYNKKNTSKKIIDHAEIIAITKASKKVDDWRLEDCELYVTLEPCNMCKEAIRQSRINRIYYLVSSNFYNETNRDIKYNLIETNEQYVVDKYKEKITSFFRSKR